MFKKILLFIFCSCSIQLFGQTEIFNLMDRRDLPLEEVEMQASLIFKATGTGQGTGYKQFQRWLYEQKFHLNSSGYIKSPQSELDAYNQALSSTSGGFGTYAVAGIWSEAGPNTWNKTSGWNPGNGRLVSIAVNPSNQNIIYVGSPGGGIWKTINGGTTWTPLSEYNSVWMYIYSITIDPINTNIIYAGTGNSGNQIIKSTDAGLTWNLIGSGPTGTIRKILIHPTSNNIVFACASNGIFRSTNSGTSWTQVRSITKEDIEFKPGDPSIMYAAGTTEIVKSTDGGLTWSTIGTSAGITGTGRSLVAVSAANPNYVYVVQASGSIFGSLYKSVNSGSSFTTTVTGNASAGTNYFGYETNGTGTTGQASHDMALCVSPANAEEVHIGGIIAWKSTNGGTSFTATTAWSLPNTVGYNHADIHGIDFVGTNMYSISDGGVYKSINNADDWTDISTGLGIRQFYRLASSPTNGNVFTAGAQDNGSTAKQSTGTWVDWLGADGMEGLVSPTNHLNIWGTSQNGQLYKSTNGGNTRTTLASITGGGWVTPLAIHPTNETIIFAGGTAVYKSTNGGTSFTNISGTTITNTLVDITVAPSNPNYIYASYSNALYVTTDGGTTWNTYTAPGTITDICVSPSNPSKIWITISSGTGRVHLSTNNGATFTNISGTLPTISARTIVVDNSSDEKLYVGMNLGVYSYSNSNPAWLAITDNLPLVAINELDIQYSTSKLRVATYGRGIWETSLSSSACIAPSGFSVTSITNTSATISWLAVAGALNYTLEYKLSTSSTWTVLAASTTSLTYNLSGLTQGTIYDIRVKTNCSSTSSFYNTSQFTTTAPAPACIAMYEPNESLAAATSILVNTAVSAGISTASDLDYFSFTLTGYNDLTISLTNLPFDYDIDIYNSAGTIIGSGANGGTNDELVVLAGQAPGTYKIKVFGYGGTFSTSQCYNLIVNAVALPTCIIPTGLTSTAIAGTSVTLNWTAVSGVLGYIVRYRITGAATWTNAGFAAGNTRNLSGLSYYTPYEWQVRSVCSPDSSAYSVSGTFTTLPNCASTIGSMMSNPLIVAVTPCGSSTYSNTQTNSTLNCFVNNYTGSFNQASPDVWYKFTLPATATVQINQCSSGLADTYIHLLDALGNHIQSVDDNGPLCAGTRASMSISLTAGTYYIATEGYGNNVGSITTVISTNLPCQMNLNLTMMIQGYHIGGSSMTSVMINEGYVGTPTATINDVDDILVELHSATPPYNLVASDSARLQTNGTAACVFPFLGGNYYIAIKHRNTIETWSAQAISFGATTVNYNFTTSSSQTFGQNAILVAPGVWAMYSGEINSDANIDLIDYSNIQNDVSLFLSGYVATDLNGDGNVDLLDLGPVEDNVSNFIFSMKP